MTLLGIKTQIHGSNLRRCYQQKGYTRMKMNTSWLICAALGIVALLTSGCASSAGIGWDAPRNLQPNGKAAVVEIAKYSGDNGVVGRNTFTVFAIPTFGISAEQPVDQSVTRAMEDAVRAAGYSVCDKASMPQDAIAVSAEVEKFKFSNYTWFWPVMKNWGIIKVDVKAKDPSGGIILQRKYSERADWTSFGSCSGYSENIRKSMTAIVQDVTDDLSRVQKR